MFDEKKVRASEQLCHEGMASLASGCDSPCSQVNHHHQRQMCLMASFLLEVHQFLWAESLPARFQLDGPRWRAAAGGAVLLPRLPQRPQRRRRWPEYWP